MSFAPARSCRSGLSKTLRSTFTTSARSMRCWATTRAASPASESGTIRKAARSTCQPVACSSPSATRPTRPSLKDRSLSTTKATSSTRRPCGLLPASPVSTRRAMWPTTTIARPSPVPAPAAWRLSTPSAIWPPRASNSHLLTLGHLPLGIRQRRLADRRLLAIAVPQVRHRSRNHRENNDGHDDQLKILFHKLVLAQHVAGSDDSHRPDEPADHVVRQKPRVVHAADAGDKRSERADDGQKAGQDDRLPAMPLEEPLGIDQMLSIEPAHDLARQHLWPDPFADVVINRVAQ